MWFLRISNSDSVLKEKKMKEVETLLANTFLVTKLLLYAKQVMFKTFIGSNFIIQMYLP